MSAPLPYWRLSGFYFFYFAVLGALVPFWSLYLQALDYTAVQIGYITAMLAFSRIVAPNVWGYLADKTGRRTQIIRSGSLLAALCFIGVFYQQSFWSMLWVVLAYSFFWNAVLAQFEVVTLNHLREQTSAYSRIRLWGSVGFIAAVVGLGLLFDFYSVTLLPGVILGLLITIWLSSLLVADVQADAESPSQSSSSDLLQGPSQDSLQYSLQDSLQDTPQDTQNLQKDTPDHGKVQISESFVGILQQRKVWVFFLACLLLQMSHGAYYTFFSVLLEGEGYSGFQIGCLWGLGVLAEIVLFLYMPNLLRRFGARPLFLAALMAAAIRWLATPLLADFLLALLLLQCLHALTFGAAHAVSIEWVRQMFPSHHGQGQAFYTAFCFGVGGVGGALLSGYVWDFGPLVCFAMASFSAALAYGLALWGLPRDL